MIETNQKSGTLPKESNNGREKFIPAKTIEQNAGQHAIDFQCLFESAPTPMLVLATDTPHYTILAVTDNYAKATGKLRDEMVGRSIFKVFPDNPDDPEASGEADLQISLDHVLQDKAADVMGIQKYDIPRADGGSGYEVRYWSPINSPVFDSQGNIACILHRVEDVTEFILLKHHASEDAASMQKVHARAEQMEAEVLQRAREVKQANRRFKQVNEALERREQELCKLNDQLQELDRVKTAFFSNVSHEFRTPLALMIGPIEEVLQSPETTPAHKKLLDIAYRNTFRLLKLVNNLLDFARIEAGRVQAMFQATDLAQLTRELASMFCSVTEKASLKLEIDCEPLPEPVYVDRDMWEKIVLNLPPSTFKHPFSGKIEVHQSWRQDHVELVVKDTGVGISEDQLEHLFERFHRVPNAKSRTQEGSGIGLALVNELVKLHGGTIQVSSVVNQGTVFTVSLPAGKAHIPENQLKEESMVETIPVKTQPFVAEALRWLPEESDAIAGVVHQVVDDGEHDIWRKPDGKVVHVLVADDNADMRNYIYRLLSPHCDVEIVSDGEMALAAAKQSPPDLILSDIMMPKLDGMQLLKKIRKDPSLKTTSVILLSARAGEEARVEGLQAGADDYLVKPFNNRELLARAKANLNLELHRAHDEAVEARELSEERFRTLFNQAAAGISQMDLSGKFLLVNQRYCEILGRSADELLHLTVQDLTLPEDVPSHLKLMNRLKKTGESYVIEKRYIRGDGSLIWVRKHVSLVRDRHGNPQSIMGVCQDITERRAAQENLKRYAGKLERSNRELEHFAMIASHDLQEPLRKVIMFSDHLEMITEDMLSVEAKDDIERLQRATRKMQSLIDNLLDLSRVTRREHPFQKVSLADLMTEVMADVHPLLKECDGQVEVGNMIELDADPSQLQQLLENLLNNAVKFHRAGVPPRITVDSKYLDANTCQISVSDNGIGIKPEYQSKIFDAFVRLNSQNAFPGNGIGLTIAQKIAERHEGSIQVESVPNEGSTFTVKLPIHQEPGH